MEMEAKAREIEDARLVAEQQRKEEEENVRIAMVGVLTTSSLACLTWHMILSHISSFLFTLSYPLFCLFSHHRK
jgi:hypothetical protein